MRGAPSSGPPLTLLFWGYSSPIAAKCYCFSVIIAGWAALGGEERRPEEPPSSSKASQGIPPGPHALPSASPRKEGARHAAPTGGLLLRCAEGCPGWVGGTCRARGWYPKMLVGVILIYLHEVRCRGPGVLWLAET